MAARSASREVEDRAVGLEIASGDNAGNAMESGSCGFSRLCAVSCSRCLLLAEAFLRRLCIKESRQSKQNIPREVLAYLRFSIFFLQFRHLKHA